MGNIGIVDFSRYAHSPAHLAVARRDHEGLWRIVGALPRLPKAGEVTTVEESIAGELTADAVSAVIDRRDVPHLDTPLQLAVRLRDPVATEILMSVGADWSLQNENGWSAFDEAICIREEAIAAIIYRYRQPFGWAKWCRRLPRMVSSVARIRDFYMEMTFHFESSVIPFIARIAPSDTYRIWKRGANLRADMTLAGFDGLRIKRSHQTFLFFGHGAPAEDGHPPLPLGSLVLLSHKEKLITEACEGSGRMLTQEEAAHRVTTIARKNVSKSGLHLTRAELVPVLNWWRQQRTETVGNWKAKVYEVHHVVMSLTSRRVPGAVTTTEEEIFNDGELDEVLSPEEKMQLDSALRMECVIECVKNSESNDVAKERKSWFGWSSKKTPKNSGGEVAREEMGDTKKGKEKTTKKKKSGNNESNKDEGGFKKGLRPVLWLTPDFPLTTDELLPLLDVFANKVKAVRRIRELLTTKLPPDTFPVKLAIPVVPTVRVLVTFTKFEELQQPDEFLTPLSSPPHPSESDAKESEGPDSWYSWMAGSHGEQSIDNSEGQSCKDEIDPFYIPPDYTWVDFDERKRRMKAKKASKTK